MEYDENDGIISAADMMAHLFGEEFGERARRANRIVSAWDTTVRKISGKGEQIAAHTQVIDLKDGVLSVETDHSAWMQLLQLYSPFILKGLSFTVPDMGIKSLVFKNRGMR